MICVTKPTPPITKQLIPPESPTHGSRQNFFFRRSKISKIIYNYLLTDREFLEDQLLLLITSNQYLQPHPAPKTRDKFDLEKLFNIPEADFRQAARAKKDRFINFLEKISSNPVCYQGGIQTQLPIAHQLALTL
ncbi:hypothetical protein VP01_4993g1 [Puccinia sorghi]|uniref:Uncharacterized protein n=1 Tax=Puccinia sorghi TaxID=27349 RepID=A0A0L6UNS7_9BASI|nr:hypothetical protein VP01_4993g1 [Puccinia sorghi]